jgi:hypothetical protein
MIEMEKAKNKPAMRALPNAPYHVNPDTMTSFTGHSLLRKFLNSAAH